jgi:hypothetical protein
MPTEQILQSQHPVEFRYLKNYTTPPNAVVTISDGDTVWYDSKTGNPNPHYRKQIARGENATTNYTTFVRKCYLLHGEGETNYYDAQGRLYYRAWSGHPNNVGWGLTAPISLDSTKADRLARQKFLSKYRERRTAFQGGVFIGEMKELVRMIRRPASALRDGIDRYHGAVKERLRRAKHKRRTIQDTWLEYSFGWTPFIKDIEDACRLATASPSRAFDPIRGLGVDVIEKANLLMSHGSGTGQRQWFIKTTTGRVNCEYKGAVKAQNNAPGFPEQLGLSWSNVLPTAWELIPWSFLVDYFTNIGEVVNGISTGTLKLAWGWSGTTLTREAIIHGNYSDKDYFLAQMPTNGTGNYYSSLAGKLESNVVYNRRFIDNVSVGIRDTSWEFPTKVKQWLNIAALTPMRYYKGPR